MGLIELIILIFFLLGLIVIVGAAWTCRGQAAPGPSENPAFKLHRGRMPMLTDKKWIVPILVEHFFADGDIDAAVKKAAEEAYGIEDARYTWVDTVRYMGLFHSVPPKERALECLQCHGASGRLDWKALGYVGDPILTRLGSTAGPSD